MTVELQKPPMLSLAEVEALTPEQAHELYGRHYNPGMAKMMGMLGFHRIRPVWSEGMRLHLADGTSILDFTGGVGVLNHGHNHPRILKARAEFAARKGMEVWKFFPSPYQAALCHNLAALFPEDLDVVFLCNSGAEANEGALKLAEKVAGPKRSKIVYTDISFHGKSHATLSVSGSESHQREHFKLLSGCIQVPHGDAETLEKAFRDNRNLDGSSQIGAFIVEAIRSEGCITPPDGYFTKVRELCDRYKVALILDEVYTGFGRTGRMFAFMHYGFTPDLVTFSKSFGGGKATLAGYVARKRLFDEAYGSVKHATLHSTTFSGFSEEVISAIEAIHVLYDERLVENAAAQGVYLLERLEWLKSRHPGIVTEVRAMGCLACVRLENMATRLLSKFPGLSLPSEIVSKVTTATVIAEMMERHRVLTFSPPHDYNLLLLTPSLIVGRAEIGEYVGALDDVLSMNFAEVVAKFAGRLKG